jgi:hypothetical protein
MVDRFVVVDVVMGRLEAEFLQNYLRGQGIQCEIVQEAVGLVDGLTIGPMGEVELLVPSAQGKKAREVLRAYHKAKEHTHP